jgi:CMP/dCMP kinase
VTFTPPLQIAIDGPAASGKTTVARLVARRLHVLYLDTGAMYRALAYLALQTRTDVDNGVALARLAATQSISVDIDETAPLGFRIAAGGRELTETMLQGNDVTAIVSTVAAHADVRAAMVAAQRRIALGGPVVMAGRDIGTVVLPNAAVKIYLTASAAARVDRRRAQLERAGVNVDVHNLRQEIEERDRLDRTRAVSPLEPASDAHVIDSSDLSVQRVVDEICAIVAREAGAR